MNTTQEALNMPDPHKLDSLSTQDPESIKTEENEDEYPVNSIEETVRHLATVAKVEEIQPIPGCDNIEYVRIRRWMVIVKKADNLKVGDLCVYCEVDSMLPKRPEFAFLAHCGYRIKTMKMRGVFSQGIVFPLSILPPRTEPYLERENLTQLLGVRKYEPPEQGPGGRGRRNHHKKGDFPEFIPKTDEERIQNCWDDSFVRFKQYNPDATCDETKKLDGMSTTVYMYNGEYVVCSRNFKVKPGSLWYDHCAKLGMEQKIRSLGKNIAFQGELVGPKCNGNAYKLKELALYFFSVFLIDEQKYMSYDEMISLCAQLGLQTVPISNRNYTIPDNYDALIAKADNSMSELNPSVHDEGMVYVFSTQYRRCRYSFKVISRNYELKKK